MVHKYEPRKVAVVGARGYSGLELIRILLRHPGARICACFATEGGFSLSDYLPGNAAASTLPPVLAMDQFDSALASVDAVFLAAPAEVSMKLAPRAIGAGVDVIDLSGVFRLNAENAAQWYGLAPASHKEAAELLPHAEYGLIPWSGPCVARRGTRARLISNPGCYATAVLLGLLPLVRSGVIDPESIVIDAKSGTTGAGRKATENHLFSEVDGECLPYRVGKHQHLPEIREAVARFSGVSIDPMFTTHLLPVRRGISAAIYSKALPGVSPESIPAKIEAAYRSAYSGYPLVNARALDEARRQELSLRAVAGSARCEIRFRVKASQVYVFSLIDNLMKGAASQAVENFNRLYDFPLTAVLEQLEGLL